MRKPPESSWDSADRWYGNLVGEKGHHYHQTIILPKSLRLLDLQSGASLLDIGCGSGILARAVPKGVHYCGIDSSKGLLEQAKKLTPSALFIQGDATHLLPVEKKDFDRSCFILSLQNMEDGKKALQLAATHLKQGGKLLLVLNHPCYRIPRQSDWGFDEKAKLQFRKMNCYMSPLKIPIQTHPSKGEKGGTTYSFHHPLSDYATWLHQAGLAIEQMEEWCSDKKSEGGRAKMEDRARKEFPLFLAILATKFIPIR